MRTLVPAPQGGKRSVTPLLGTGTQLSFPRSGVGGPCPPQRRKAAASRCFSPASSAQGQTGTGVPGAEEGGQADSEHQRVRMAVRSASGSVPCALEHPALGLQPPVLPSPSVAVATHAPDRKCAQLLPWRLPHRGSSQEMQTHVVREASTRAPSWTPHHCVCTALPCQSLGQQGAGLVP